MFPLEVFLTNFRTEVAAVFDKTKAVAQKQIREEELRSRIRELMISWNAQTPAYGLIQSKGEVQRVQIQLAEIANLSTRIARKQDYYVYFREILKNLDRLIVDIKTSLYLAAAPPAKAQTRFLTEISDLPSDMLPKGLVGRKATMESFLKEHPFDTNVFIIVRYAPESELVIKAVSEAINAFEGGDTKFFAVVARDHKISDDLYNPIACLLCCKYGIVIFDSDDNRPEINPNVAYELGYMHLLQRNCLLLKDRKLKTLNSDILHKLYEGYTTAESAAEATRTWLSEIVSGKRTEDF